MTVSIAKDYFQHDMNNRPSPESRFMIFWGTRPANQQWNDVYILKKKGL